MVSRILSAVLAIGYIATAYFAVGEKATVQVAAFLVLPMACIWFSEEMGSYTGVMRGQAITAATPGCLVAFGGWFLLLSPFVYGLVYLLSR